MLNISQFRELIVKSTLKDMLLYSEDVEELMVFTCAAESCGGTYIVHDELALGIYCMDSYTYNDIWQNYLKQDSRLCMILFSNLDVHFQPSIERLIYDLRFATAMARIYYESLKTPIPNRKDENALWEYYNNNYRSSKIIQKEIAIKRYHDFVRGSC